MNADFPAIGFTRVAPLTVCLATPGAAAQDTGEGGDEAALAAVRAATGQWVEAFNARDPARIAALYAPEAVFWGTISPTVRTMPEAVFDYFADSVRRRPRLRIDLGEAHVRLYGETAVDSGVCTSLDPRAEGTVGTHFCCTFVYRRVGDRWITLAHHSSRVATPP